MVSHEYQITVFSPEGKLHQVEYAFKAIRSSGLTSIALRGKNCVVAVTEKRVGDRMIDPATVTNLHMIIPQIGCLVTGRETDGRSWVSRLRQEAFDFQQENGSPITVDVLAMRGADLAQLYTQKSTMRAYACELILFSVEPEFGPQLFKIDPAGHYMGYHSVTAGVKEQDAINHLEKEWNGRKGFQGLSDDDTIRLAIDTLQKTIGQDFKPTDIEVGFVNGVQRTFRKLGAEEVEAHLQVIQRFD